MAVPEQKENLLIRIHITPAELDCQQKIALNLCCIAGSGFAVSDKEDVIITNTVLDGMGVVGAYCNTPLHPLSELRI